MPASKTDGAVCGFFLVACVGGGGWDGELGWVGGLVGVGTWLGVGVHMAKTWATHASRGFGVLMRPPPVPKGRRVISGWVLEQSSPAGVSADEGARQLVGIQ